MASTAVRQTLFVLISAVERDLREIIKTHLANEVPPEQLLTSQVYEAAVERLEQDEDRSSANPTLQQLLPYTDFSDAIDTVNRHRAALPEALAKACKSRTKQFESAVAVRNRVMHGRPLKVGDLPVISSLADELSAEDSILWSATSTELQLIRERPGYVLGVEVPIQEEERQQHNLPLPDFDETGFVGRREELVAVKNALTGAYPVITILAEGGAGKTALALKASYDLLESSESHFDAYVWASSKTSQLTPNEIVRIDNAIQDSLGVFRALASELAGQNVSDPMGEVLEYMREFRLLLILDNLETVLDDQIARLVEDPPLGSKILITSRIGLGSSEKRVRLGRMDQSDAVMLLREVARARDVGDLVRTSNARLGEYCKRMNHNPGHIKWFVSAVETGKRPEEVLANPEVFLNYCMSNVYEFLEHDPRLLLNTLLSVPNRRSLPELAFLSGMGTAELQNALQQLMRTNMVAMTSQPKGASYETRYELNDLARTFLARHHPVSTELHQQIRRRNRQLVSASEDMRRSEGRSPYDVNTISMRSESDLILGKYLTDALSNVRRKRYEDAEHLLGKAKRLSPEFFEVHRVEAWLHTQQRNVVAAQQAYEAAIELEPKSAPLRLWYAGFLLRYLDDVEGCAEQLEHALKLDPEATAVQTELARAYLYSHRFEEARSVLEQLLETPELTEKERRIGTDLKLQYHHRRSDHLATAGENLAALHELQELKKTFTTIPRLLLDDRMRNVLEKAVPTARRCGAAVDDPVFKETADGLALWLWEEGTTSQPHQALPSIGEQLSGEIKSLPPQATYGFVSLPGGGEIFFHKSRLLDEKHWIRLRVGDKLHFVVGEYNGSLCATEIAPDPDKYLGQNDSRVGEVLKGEVTRLPRGKTFGFIRSREGPEYFVRKSEVVPPERWELLKVGDRVQFEAGPKPPEKDMSPHALNVRVLPR